jgi:hypothetical protein
MANKYDGAALAANADRLEALAKTARSTMLRETTEKATRLGSEGERLARQARAAETQQVDADKLSAGLLAEEAAKAREGANVARAKSQVAAEDAKRLADEATALRKQEQAVDAELADLGGRMPVTELAVDHLEWHAEKARAMADAVRQADDLQAQAVVAAGRGDHVAADALTIRASTLRETTPTCSPSCATTRRSPPTCARWQRSA